MKKIIKTISITIDGVRYQGYLYPIEDSKIEQFDMEHTIDELDLSVRTYNCLKRYDIHTLSDIKKQSLDTLYKIKNLGTKSLREIYTKVYKTWLYIIPCNENNILIEKAIRWREHDF